MAKVREQPSKWPVRPPTTGMRLSDDLVLWAKHRALDERTSLGKLIERLLREYRAKVERK